VEEGEDGQEVPREIGEAMMASTRSWGTLEFTALCMYGVCTVHLDAALTWGYLHTIV
jgi:hypothetical protein